MAWLGLCKMDKCKHPKRDSSFLCGFLFVFVTWVKAHDSYLRMANTVKRGHITTVCGEYPSCRSLGSSLGMLSRSQSCALVSPALSSRQEPGLLQPQCCVPLCLPLVRKLASALLLLPASCPLLSFANDMTLST